MAQGSVFGEELKAQEHTYRTKHSKIDIKTQEIIFPENNRSSEQGSEAVADR